MLLWHTNTVTRIPIELSLMAVEHNRRIIPIVLLPTRSVVFANLACINYLTGDILAGKGAMFYSKSKANVYQKNAACLAYFKKHMRKE